MLYTPLTKKAMQIAFEAHKDQVDKNGIPYIYHPVHLAEQMTDESTVCVALLHDVVEDTDITFEQLEQAGFAEEIIKALRLLTHDEAVPYMEYVREIKGNPIAAKVKLADLKHNSDLTRLDVVDERAKKRAEKYRKAIELLTSGAETQREGITAEGQKKPDLNHLLAYYLSTAREMSRLTQTQLAARTGIYQADISKLERGLGNPSLSTLKRLADGMDMELMIRLVQKTDTASKD